MNRTAYHLLRVSMAITFLWIGILIFKEPEGWGLTYLQPWAAGLLPIPLKEAMISTAILDMVIGFVLLIGTWAWLAALLGAFHLVIVLTVSGINEVTVRDIGLLGALLALVIESFPKQWAAKFNFWKDTSAA